MTDVLQKIDEIISRKHDFRVQAAGGAYFLEEPKEETYPKTLVKQKGKMLMLQLDVEDSNKIIFPFFNSEMSGVTQICDYIIFYPKNDTLFIFLCEQKTSKADASDQVEAGWVLAEFIVRMAQRMLRFKPFKVEYRALVFSLSKKSQFASSIQTEAYAILPKSQLKKQVLKAGDTCFLDNLCF